MRKVGFITHPDCRLHTMEGHPEAADRTMAIEEYFEHSGLLRELATASARFATDDELILNHDRDYVALVKNQNRPGIHYLDPDTYVTEQSFNAASLSYGGALLAVDMVLSGEWDRAFVCLRPPGHHALRDSAMGFCLFNNIAGAARYAQSKYGLKRNSIVDFDVHHGNGTQWSFYEDESIHYASSHQYPFYPGTGSLDEIGKGNGRGSTLNMPLPAGTDGIQAIERWRELYLPAMSDFRPELILISAGFDAHFEDPLASLRFQDEDYFAITRMFSEIADKFCQGRIVSVLEGGYNRATLARSAAQHVKGLLQDG